VSSILVTGAAGFVGCHLARVLSDNPAHSLTLVDNFTRGRRDEEFASVVGRDNVRLIECDLTDSAAAKRLGRDFDSVYHLAAVIGVKNVLERPWDVIRVNAVATLNIIEWFRDGGGRKLLFASTSEAYAWTARTQQLPVPTPESVPLSLTDLANPRASYAGSKIFGELAVTHGCTGLPFVIVRFHNVYGPRMGMEHVIPELFHRCLAGENPLTVYNPDHRRAFCYVDDAIDAVIACMTTDSVNGETINIGNDAEEIEIGALARRILQTAGINAEISPRHASHDPIIRRCPDISKARRLLGFKPRFDLDAGLTRTLDWYRPSLSRRLALAR
jgi:nucleoside-diphosphate-sugar epimerase